MKLDIFQQQVFFTTLRIEVSDGTASSIGTGFFVKFPIPRHPDRVILMLLTCKHVLLGGKGGVSLVCHKKNPSGQPSLAEKVVVSSAPYSTAYYEHPDPEMDIAAINLSGFLGNHPEVFYKTLTPENVFSFSEEAFGEGGINAGSDVSFLGYPTGFHDQAHNLPILRFGRIASFPEVDFNGKPEFLIDAQVFPGSSGSPVFVIYKGEFQFIGMVGKSVIHRSEVATVTVATKSIVTDFVGLGIVYKPQAIVDFLRTFADKQALLLDAASASALTEQTSDSSEVPPTVSDN